MSERLVIAAHGSSSSSKAAVPVMALAAELASRPAVVDRYAVVEARFLAQSPLLDETPNTGPTTIVPFFMAEGHFTRTVLPSRFPGEAVITAALGSVDLSAVVGQVASGVHPRPHLVLVGHGTRRDPASGGTVLAHAEALAGDFASVTVSFIDQDPELDTTWSRVPADGVPVIVVPFLATPGPHFESDIPEGLGLHGSGEGPHDVGGHRVWYRPPLGAAPGIVDVVERLALAVPRGD